MIGNSLLLGPEGYQISRSVRLRSSANAYLSRTPGSAGNRTTWTWSGWVKRGNFGGTVCLLGGSDGVTSSDAFYFSADAISYFQSGGAGMVRSSTAVYRDPSAWYHIVGVSDSSNATAQNRFRVYVNGVEVTAWATNTTITQNRNGFINSNTLQLIGANVGPAQYFDGYLTEINFIDGQALTPISFGETDAITGVWKPKKYAGTYGTNGFYLNFSDNSNNTATTIGKDYSGNGNNWTPNNISLTSGATYDSMLDVPTPWADGGNGRGNYCTLSPIIDINGATFSNGNLVMSSTVGGYGKGYGTFALPLSGKWYWEGTLTALSSAIAVFFGISSTNQQDGTNRAVVSNSSSGSIVVKTTTTATGVGTWALNDVAGVAVDMDAKTVQFYKNGSTYGSSQSISSLNFDIPIFPFFHDQDSGASVDYTANFGQRPFAYTPPSGFKALNTGNLPEPTIKKGNQYFDATLYTGNGSTGGQTITNSGMQPDLVWIKSRSNAYNHKLYDAVRGATLALVSNTTDAEATISNSLTAFNSNGFTIGGNDTGTNGSGSTFVAWQWKEGATQGFDIVTYSATGAAQNIAHNLGVAPSMVIVKNRTGATTRQWCVYHKGITNSQNGGIYLNLTNAWNSDSTIFNNTAPTSTQFTVGTYLSAGSETYVAYLFAEVAGFSKFGSFTTNGTTDNAFVFCGFAPRFIMFKVYNSGAAGNWEMWDSARSPSNVRSDRLSANLPDAEVGSQPNVDILSNGFKLRGAYTNGNSYIFAAFAENPFKYSLAR